MNKRLGIYESHMFSSLHPKISINILSTVISYITDKEHLFENQELLKLMIISFLFMTLIIDLRVTCQEKLELIHS